MRHEETMTAVAYNTPERRERALAAFNEKPDGIVEAIAGKADVTPAEVLEILPPGAAVTIPAEQFSAIWSDMMTWGEVLMIVQTADIVLEVPGFLPEGTESHGWFNIHGDSPIGGHIKKDNCHAISFVDRAFHGRRSCSVWFMNANGQAMFKVFVRRDENKELKADQLSKFETLRDSLSR
jgi:putative heme utilization carrier protein HutX